MIKNNSNNLLQGNLKINLLKMSLPTMFGFLMQSVYDLVDMMWIGRISSSAVAGVTIFATIFWLVEILNEIIGTSSISLISQSYGSDHLDKTGTVIEQTLAFKALVAIIAAVILAIILKPAFNFFSKDKEVITSALNYGYIRIFFLPIMFSSYTVNTALRCLGDAKKPMYIMIVSAILNIILDPIFIFDVVPGTNISGLNLGIFGAALATVISVTVSFLLAFWILMSGKSKVKPSIRGIFKLNFEIDKKLLTIGLPSGAELLMRNLSNILILKLISFYGTNVVAAFGIGNRLMGFAFMPLVGFSMGSSAIIGQCLGAEDIERGKSTAKFATLLNVLIMICVSIISFFFAKQIINIFIHEKPVIDIGITMIRIIAPSLIFAGVVMGLGSVFSGSGYNIPFLISSVVSRWVVQFPLVLIILLNKLPLYLIWLSFIITEIAEMSTVLYFYKKGNWEHKRV